MWTVQSREAWERLYEFGVHQAIRPPELDESFSDAYAWMRGRLVDRFGWDLDAWPVWGWARIARRDLAPEGGRESGMVLMRLEVPRDLVVPSHFDGWHAVLNSTLLYLPELADEEDDQVCDAWRRDADARVTVLGGSPEGSVRCWPPAARAYAEQTWEAIFDVDSWSPRHYLQCVIPGIEASWVVDAVVLE